MTAWTSQFGDSIGWGSSASYWQTVRFPDLNGDGKGDVCGRSSTGMVCALSNGTSFGGPPGWSSDFSDATYWNDDPKYWQTIQFVDVNGDLKADICGRGTDGLYCALSTGTAFAALSRWSSDFGDGQSWGDSPSYWQTVRFPDLNGDGKADVCGRGDGGLLCALSTGTSFGAAMFWTTEYGDTTYWGNDPKYWQTLQFVDLNGDKRADVCGRGTDGVYCALSTGTALAEYKRWTGGFGDNGNWGSTPAYWQTVRFPDINGDGKADVCGRGNSSLFCAVSDGSSFGAVTEWSARYPDADGWSSDAKYWGTFQYLDLNNDGKADVCGRLSGGLLCSIASY
jgi:hypothetical protein